MIQVYTGTGKGKTTAALGLAFRALGQGKRVLLLQFLKKGRKFGEVKAGQRFNKFKILQAGPGSWVRKGAATLKHRQLSQQGLLQAQQAIESRKYDLIILDELNVAVDLGLLKADQVKKILKKRPQAVEIVITGRGLHPEILAIADLVSEVREIKHYYKKGVLARKGIEY